MNITQMKYFSVKEKTAFTLLILSSWVLMAGFSISGFLPYQPVIRQPHFFSNTKIYRNFSPYSKTYNCCSKKPSNKFSKTEYIINFNEELNFKLSSKRFYVLQHGIIESFKNSAFLNNNYTVSGNTLLTRDIPVITSSLLI